MFSQGFYWDDWSQLFLRIKFGDQYYWKYFLADRPTSAWTSILFARLLNNDPRLWHIFIILLKYLTSILSYILLEKIWPHNNFRHLLIISLFILCPLFSQLYISVAYTQHYLNFILFLLSVIFLINSTKAEKKSTKILFYIFSVIFMIFQLSITEYFSFLELIKLPILFILFQSQSFSVNESIKKSIKLFLPFLLLFCIYCVFRLNYSRIFPILEADKPSLYYDFLNNPLQAFLSFIKNALSDVCYIFTSFIGKVFTVDIETLFRPFNFLVIFLGMVLFFFLLSFLSKIGSGIQDDDKAHRSEMLAIAIFWIFLSILPFWMIGDSYITAADPPHADRNFLASVLGVSIIFYLILEWFIQSRSKLIIAFCFLSVFLFHQYTEENDAARWQTKKQNDIYWQIYTRMPGIQSNTALVDEKVIFPFQGNFATASAINILYQNPINENGTVPLWVFNIDGVLFEQHAGYHTTKRNFEFIAPSEQSIFLDYQNQFSNCIWVFSPEDIDNPHLSEIQKSWIPHSDISRIRMDIQSPPDKKIFGSQPENWCIYYQQAALFRQFQYWDKLHDLTNSVLDDGFTPSLASSNSPFEWWPFIESLIRSKNFEKAQELTLQSIQTDPAYKNFFCNRWNNLLNEISVTYNTENICVK